MITHLDKISRTDDRGSLTVFQSCPFPIKRFYFMDADSGVIRGRHAHRRNLQYCVLLQGSVIVFADYQGPHGMERKQTSLTTRFDSLPLPVGEFHWIQFEEPSSLLIICSHEYDPDDYIYADEFYFD